MYLFKFSVHCSLFITCWSSNFSLNWSAKFILRFFTFQIYFAALSECMLFCGPLGMHVILRFCATPVRRIYNIAFPD